MSDAEKKYELVAEDTIEVFGIKLFRIRATRTFSTWLGEVKEGQLGGYVRSEDNLSHGGEARVGGKAWVDGKARVGGKAWVDGEARVGGKARVDGEARVGGEAWVDGEARVGGKAWVGGEAWVGGGVLVGELGRNADHWNDPLWSTRQDIFSILDQAPAEVSALREAMVDGRINGSVYNDGNGCGCLCGTIGIVHAGSGAEGSVNSALEELGIKTDGSRPAERWFIDIVKGDKPLPVDDDSIDWAEQTESVFRLSRALAWLDEWIESRMAIAKVLGA